MSFKKIILLLSFSFLLSACQSTYYSAMEKAGIHKRDILVDRIEAVQNAQQEGQEQFSSALDQFKSVINFDGGELQDQYEKLNDEYENSVDAAENISSRINKVEDVAEALFSEWEAEIDEYSNERFKRDSANKLKNTRRKYTSLLRAMRKAESTLEPVLSALKDNTLYLKHNLNARAIASLKGELESIDRDVSSMITAMKKAISESDHFIKQLKE